VFDSTRNTNRDSEIYKIELNNLSNVTRLTTTVGNEDDDWNGTNDSSVFSSERSGAFGPWTMSSDGGNQSELFPGNPNEILFPKWNAAGDKIVFVEEFTRSDQRIFWADISGLNRHYLTNQNRDDSPTFSPVQSGTEKVLFSRIRVSGGTHENKRDLFTINVDGTGLTNLTNTADGTFNDYPCWSPDGQFIVFSRSISHGLPRRRFEKHRKRRFGGSRLRRPRRGDRGLAPRVSPEEFA
jgi:Tol biopolymer transport system component